MDKILLEKSVLNILYAYWHTRLHFIWHFWHVYLTRLCQGLTLQSGFDIFSLSLRCVYPWLLKGRTIKTVCVEYRGFTVPIHLSSYSRRLCIKIPSCKTIHRDWCFVLRRDVFESYLNDNFSFVPNLKFKFEII